MKKLFASASYSFSNFYNNLNAQGQIIFSIIIFLILLLCLLLFIVYIIQGIQSKSRIKKLKSKTDKAVSKAMQDTIDTALDKTMNINLDDIKKADNDNVIKEPAYVKETTEVEDIAKKIEDALVDNNPINLTNFEEDQEKTAIISIDELLKKAKELELIADQEDGENTGINFLEKYNLEPAEVSNNDTTSISGEVKAFRVSQVISPIYGVKKEAIDNDEEDND